MSEDLLQPAGVLASFGSAYLPVSNAAMLRHASFIETVEGPFDGPGVVLNMSAEGLARAFYYTLFRSETVGGTLPVLSAIEFVAGHTAALGPADRREIAKAHTQSLQRWELSSNFDARRLRIGVFYGAKDPVFSEKQTEALIQQLGGAERTQRYPDQGHIPVITEPRLFEDIFDFLR